MMARFRCGNEERENKYWMEEEARMCMMCRDERETIEHMWRGCGEMREREEKERGETLNEDGREIGWMKEVWKRRERIEKERAYEDCAISYHCAQRIVTNYLAKYGRDCNDDGVTDCDDFSMINFNGGYQCKPELGRNEAGKLWLDRYRTCNPETRL
ncbi:hypothetical protein GEV33_003775 [Tenebrio molitor]|uniref:lysozyme n=1 Tax=Tenebrio molitor TaxID=7067 RepID=A0A8J6HPB9_TENMO|nr:hypothetical protein GEV33_003775 [Tenebrio molitor]